MLSGKEIHVDVDDILWMVVPNTLLSVQVTPFQLYHRGLLLLPQLKYQTFSQHISISPL